MTTETPTPIAENPNVKIYVVKRESRDDTFKNSKRDTTKPSIIITEDNHPPRQMRVQESIRQMQDYGFNNVREVYRDNMEAIIIGEKK
jgi:hypothetical protein